MTRGRKKEIWPEIQKYEPPADLTELPPLPDPPKLSETVFYRALAFIEAVKVKCPKLELWDHIQLRPGQRQMRWHKYRWKVAVMMQEGINEILLWRERVIPQAQGCFSPDETVYYPELQLTWDQALEQIAKFRHAATRPPKKRRRRKRC